MAVFLRNQWGGLGGAEWNFQQVPTSIGVTTLPDAHESEKELIVALDITGGRHATHQGFPPGQNMNTSLLSLADGREITSISGMTNFDTSFDSVMLQSLSFGTTTGPFSAGQHTEGATAFEYTLQAGESVAGFAGRSGVWVDAIGLLIGTQDVSAAISLDTSLESNQVTVDIVGAIELYDGDAITWTPSSCTPSTFTFYQIDFYNSSDETTAVGGWNIDRGTWADEGFYYTFPETPTARKIRLIDTDRPVEPQSHWYKIQVKDAEGNIYILDPEVINYSRRL